MLSMIAFRIQIAISRPYSYKHVTTHAYSYTDTVIYILTVVHERLVKCLRTHYNLYSYDVLPCLKLYRSFESTVFMLNRGRFLSYIINSFD